MTQWTPVFNGEIGKSRVSVEKGDHGMYRITTCKKHTEVEIQIHGETPDELARNLMDEGLFPENEARRIAEKIVH